jgi:hypothetical protein
MEVKEAIRRIEEHNSIHFAEEYPRAIKITDALIMAIEALKKQVPMKPKKLTNKLLLDAGWVYECPTCGCACGENKYHPEVTCDDLYCTQCGQMLDWN